MKEYEGGNLYDYIAGRTPEKDELTVCDLPHVNDKFDISPEPIKRKKILIGIPAFDGVVAEAQQSMFSMVFRAGRDLPHIDVGIHIGYKREQFRARNNIVDAAIASDMDYILMLDDDMVVPHNLVERLIAHDKDIVGALYYQRGGTFNPVIMQRFSQEPGLHGAAFIPPNDPMLTTNRGLHEVDVIGGGCMLFKADVFRSIIQPYFESERRLGTDLSICGRFKDAGKKIYVDTTIELGHVGEKQIVTSRTIPVADQCMAIIAQQLKEDVKGYLGMHEEELLSAMDRCATKESRQKAWGERDSGNWDEVREYYQSEHDWHILNLAYWNLRGRDAYKEWAIVQGTVMLDKGAHVLDYGSGLGHLSVPLAQRGLNVHTVDIMSSPTQEFVQWRKDKHKLDNLDIFPLHNESICYKYEKKMDGAFCISVMDHLTKPYETVQWIADQLKPGAFFLCEWMSHSPQNEGEEEPQHLDRYDIATFEKWMHSIGFTTSPEYKWLFFKQ